MKTLCELLNEYMDRMYGDFPPQLRRNAFSQDAKVSYDMLCAFYNKRKQANVGMPMWKNLMKVINPNRDEYRRWCEALINHNRSFNFPKKELDHKLLIGVLEGFYLADREELA